MTSSYHSDADMSLDESHSGGGCGGGGDGSASAEQQRNMLSSPPRTALRRSRAGGGGGAGHAPGYFSNNNDNSRGMNNNNNVNTRAASTFRSRLFMDDEEEEGGILQQPPLRKKLSILKPLDLNLDFDDVSEHGIDSVLARSSSSSSHNNNHNNRMNPSPEQVAAARKRQSEEHDLYAGRNLSFDREEDLAGGGDDNDYGGGDIDGRPPGPVESPVDMYTSPQISPSYKLYRSPGKWGRGQHSNTNHANNANNNAAAAIAALGKSPSSFRTLDGRIVESKNPFSPMMMRDDTPTAAMSAKMANVQLGPGHSPVPPPMLSLEESKKAGSGYYYNSHLRLAQKLQKRGGSSNINCSSFNDGSAMDLMSSPTSSSRKPAATMAANGLAASMTLLPPHNDATSIKNSAANSSSWYTRDGYPEKTGRYSFTGSPIKESQMESLLKSPGGGGNDEWTTTISGPPLHPLAQQVTQEACTNIHKVRRRSKEQDVAAAAAAAEEEGKQHRSGRGLRVSTTAADAKNGSGGGGDNISPTDIFSFPLLRASPSDTSTVPSAPSKVKPVRRPPVRRYTPIRKSVAPPQTPMPERHQLVRQRRLERSSSFEEDKDFMDSTEMATPSSHRGGGGLNFAPGDPTASHHYNQRPLLPNDHQMVAAPPAASAPSRFYSDFDVIAELGNGSFGKVFKVLSRLDGCMYAIKVAHRPAKGNADRDRMLKEVYALAALSDQADTATFHIVRYHQAWMEEERLYIQTELCTTTLQEELRQAAPAVLPVERQYKCLREILLALEFIHKNGMVHLDIKPENIFLKNDQFKLGDFGLVSKISSHDVEEGDSRYMSLELLSGDHADLTKSDIFSLGITMYEVCLGGSKMLPSNGPEWQALRSTGAPLLPGVPVELYEIVQTMLRRDYCERPGASELLARPQLLSNEQKLLMHERNKVLQANMALMAQSSKFREQSAPPLPNKGTLTRASTWNGTF